MYSVWVIMMLLYFFVYRKLADKIAAAGFYVVVPDFLYGDPYDPSNSERALPVWIKDHGAVSFGLLFCSSFCACIVINGLEVLLVLVVHQIVCGKILD